jgi:hypothetical protein
MSMLHLVQIQQAQYTLAQDDVVAYALLAQGSSEFIEPQSSVCGLILYEQLFQKLKTLLILNHCLTAISRLDAIKKCYVLCNNKCSCSLTCSSSTDLTRLTRLSGPRSRPTTTQKIG